MINRLRYNWKKNKLYFGNKFTGTELLVDPRYSSMFWINTLKGKTDDFYNLTRAKQHALDLTIKDALLEGCL